MIRFLLPDDSETAMIGPAAMEIVLSEKERNE
jgi:hypothetical protein